MIAFGPNKLTSMTVFFGSGLETPEETGLCGPKDHIHMRLVWAPDDLKGVPFYLSLVEQADGEWLVHPESMEANIQARLASTLSELGITEVGVETRPVTNNEPSIGQYL